MVFQIKAKLVYNKRIKDAYFHCALYAHRIAKEASPGQFVNIKLTDTCEPLLRRPFSIHRVTGEGIEILYELVGPGTEILSKKKSGEYLDIIGPLGNGFNYRLPPVCRQAGITDYRLPILIAGGMGVAPLIFLAEKLGERKALKQVKRKTLVLLGTKTAQQILCEKEFKKLGCEVRISTDDGSKGFKGKVTALLKRYLATGYRPQATGKKIKKPTACSLRLAAHIYACGPRAMLKEISLFSKKHNIPAQISLEEHMACGIGACFGCAINTKKGFKRACKEGPVFNAEEIV
jgi:dihydroorotate dehydrogenase electron transfer subunit